MPLLLTPSTTLERLFDDTYEVILADTETSRAIHRKIRYQVYCLERQFENPADFPHGEEHDRWDHHAASFIVRHRASWQWVAAMRIVLPYAATFPLEALHCLDPARKVGLPRRQLGEISRVCVIRSPTPHARNPHLNWEFGHVNQDRESEIVLGFIRTLIIYGLDRGIEHYYLLITGALARLLRRLGMVLHPVGGPIEHRGWRTPYRMGVRESMVSLCRQSPAVRDLFARQGLAYQPFSMFDDDIDDLLGPMRPFLPPLAASGHPRAGARLPAASVQCVPGNPPNRAGFFNVSSINR